MTRPKWHPASKPPENHRQVLIKYHSGFEHGAWHCLVDDKWYTRAGDRVPVPIGWREVPKRKVK